MCLPFHINRTKHLREKNTELKEYRIVMEMESNTSDYRKRLNLLLDKLSPEFNRVSSHVDYPKILNSNNSEQLVEILKELDARIASRDQNLSHSGNSSELTTDPLSLFHEVINGYAVLAISAIGLILNILGIYFLSSSTEAFRKKWTFCARDKDSYDQTTIFLTSKTQNSFSFLG